MILAIPRHLGLRPQWICCGCGQPYPCRAARARLVAVHGRGPRLARAGTTMLDLAVRDGLSASPEQLWQQFVAWTEPTPSRSA